MLCIMCTLSLLPCESRPCTYFLLLWEDGMHFIRRCWLSCRNRWGDCFVPTTKKCVTLVGYDSLYSGLRKWWESLFYLALIKIAPAVQVLDTKIRSGRHTQGSRGIQVQNAVPARACLPKIVLIPGLFSPFQVDRLFFLLSNLSLPVTAHFNFLCLYHATFATFFWLNIEPCWSPPTQPTSLLFCITPSCSTRHGKMSRLLEEEALGRAFLLLVQSGAR